MPTFSGSILTFSGIKGLTYCTCYPKMPLHDADRFRKFQYGTALAPRRIQNLQKPYVHRQPSATTHILCAGRNYELNYTDGSRKEPFLLNMIREAIWTTRSLLVFLAEQPSQLKYIEWPSFQSTLKTATLTLVLVALLIVALSSVDSALSYSLAFLLRRKA